MAKALRRRAYAQGTGKAGEIILMTESRANLIECVEDEVAMLLGRIEGSQVDTEVEQTIIVLIAGRLLALCCLDPVDTLKRSMSAWSEMMTPGFNLIRGN